MDKELASQNWHVSFNNEDTTHLLLHFDQLKITENGNHCQKIEYNKRNIEKLLNESGYYNIEVILSYSNEQKQDTDHYASANELVERIWLYGTKQDNNPQCYLVIDCTRSSLVTCAYLAVLRSSKKDYWKLKILPLINYLLVRKRAHMYLSYQLKCIEVTVWGMSKYYDNVKSVLHFGKLLECAKLRIKYFKLNFRRNFRQYKLELDSIYELSEFSIYEAHKEILEKYPSDNNQCLKKQKGFVIE